MYNRTRIQLVILCCAGMSFSGCGPSQPSLADYNNTNIRKTRAAYGIYVMAHDFEAPDDENTFKEFLTTSKVAEVKMQRMGVSKNKILDIFVSERDGKPFKIRYGIDGIGDNPIVFETDGVNGKRFVAFADPRELEADDYEKCWAGEAIQEAAAPTLNRPD